MNENRDSCVAARWIADIRESLGPAVVACHLEGWTISSKGNSALQLLPWDVKLVVVVQTGALPLSSSRVASLESLGLKVSPPTTCAWWGVERMLQTAQTRISHSAMTPSAMTHSAMTHSAMAKSPIVEVEIPQSQLVTSVQSKPCSALPLAVSLSLVEPPYTPSACYRHPLFSSDEIAWQDGVVQFCRERSLDSDLSIFTALHEAEGRWRITALAALKQRGLETPELQQVTSRLSSAIESPAVLHAARSWLSGDAQSDGCFRPLYALPAALAALLDGLPLGDVPREPGWTDRATDLKAKLT